MFEREVSNTGRIKDSRVALCGRSWSEGRCGPCKKWTTHRCRFFLPKCRPHDL